MTAGGFFQLLGMVSAIALPLFNIPLIWRIQKRKSSGDLSPIWAWGIWLCLVGMLPSGLASADPVFRIFTIVNLALFSVVLVQVLRFQ